LKAIPDEELNEDIPKSTEKSKESKKQKDSSSGHSMYSKDRKKLKLSEDEAAKPESSNFISLDEVCFF